MSHNLRMTLRTPNTYLHSPVDDLCSFCYTAQWAAAFNDGASGGKHNGDEIRQFREMISGDQWQDAVYLVQNVLRHASQKVNYGPFFAPFLALLNPWWTKLYALVGDWHFELGEAGTPEGEDKEKRLGLKFLIFAYRGVGEYFELLHKHRGSLQVSV